MGATGVGALAQSGSSEASAPLTIHFIDVGQGDSTLITCPNGATILIDAGSLSGRQPREVRDLIQRQIGPLGDVDYLIVSHPDADHYNLLERVLDGIAIRRAYYVGQASDYSEGFLAWLEEASLEAIRLGPTDYDRQDTANPDIDCGRAGIWILAAGVQARASPSNAKSIVVMVRMGNFEAMITGDATTATEDVIVSRYAGDWLDIDVLRVGHHGSLETSTSQRWADTLTPTTAIVSAGYTNRFGHPRAEVIARLAPHTRPAPGHWFRDATRASGAYIFRDHRDYREDIYSTARSGTVVVRTTGNGYRVTPGQ